MIPEYNTVKFPRNRKHGDIPKGPKDELVARSHAIRKNPVILMDPDNHSVNSDDDSPQSSNIQSLTQIQAINVQNIVANDTIHNRSSVYLKQITWRKSLCKCFEGIVQKEYNEDVHDDVLNDADALLDLLLGRLSQHLSQRGCPDAMNHFSILWAMKNFSRICAAVAYFGHVIDGLSRMACTPNSTYY